MDNLDMGAGPMIYYEDDQYPPEYYTESSSDGEFEDQAGGEDPVDDLTSRLGTTHVGDTNSGHMYASQQGIPEDGRRSDSPACQQLQQSGHYLGFGQQWPSQRVQAQTQGSHMSLADAYSRVPSSSGYTPSSQYPVHHEQIPASQFPAHGYPNDSFPGQQRAASQQPSHRSPYGYHGYHGYDYGSGSGSSYDTADSSQSRSYSTPVIHRSRPPRERSGPRNAAVYNPRQPLHRVSRPSFSPRRTATFTDEQARELYEQYRRTVHEDGVARGQ
jgi:hypothetical protein